MRVLFYASNPAQSGTLRLEHEITELQRASTNSGRRIDFIFLPALGFEDVGEQIANFRPDVVHVSAHGTPDNLILADSSEGQVKLTAEALLALLSSQPPKLVYISACDSETLATSIVSRVPFAIGTTEAITNLAARKGAVNFYRGLLRGQNIMEAFESSKMTITTLSDGKVTSVLRTHEIHDPKREVLYEPTRLIARFEDDVFLSDKQGCYKLLLGVAGCPPSTIQIIFCTDDQTFLSSDDDTNDEGEDEDQLAARLCSAVRTVPVRGEIWLEESWEEIPGDFRLFAFGTTAAGDMFSVGCFASEALEAFYRVYFDSPDPSGFPDDLKKALQDLRFNDGSQLRPLKPQPQIARAKPKKIKSVNPKKVSRPTR